MRLTSGIAAVVVTTLFVFGSALVADTSAQFSPAGAPQPVKWSLSLEPEAGSVVAGGSLKAVVTAKIDEGWHVYAPDEANSGPRPVTVNVSTNPVFSEAGKLDAPEAEREMDEAFGQITASYTHEAIFRLPVTVAAGAPAGVHPLKLEITFQACDGRMCLPAKVVRLEANVTVTR